MVSDEPECPGYALGTAVTEGHGPQDVALGPGQLMEENLKNCHGREYLIQAADTLYKKPGYRIQA